MARKRSGPKTILFSANAGAAPVGSGMPLSPGRGTGVDGRQTAAPVTQGGGPDEPDGKLVVARRHTDWIEHQIGWRWLLDSYEGGERYRNAVYGPDRKGLPARNLFRHKNEYPDPQQNPAVYQGFAGFVGMSNVETNDIGYGPYPGQIGAAPAATAQDDDYEYRRSRTPVPEWTSEAVGIWLAKLYCHEVRRTGPADLTAWWADVDGRGTPIDDYVRNTLAPLLLTLGCLDVCLDHPQAPPGETIATRADELRLGLDKCVISYILPQNMVWYRLDTAGRYLECLVREYTDPTDRIDRDAKSGKAIDPEDPGNIGQAWRRDYVRYRRWTTTESVLYSYNGDEVLSRTPHPYGCVPIVRLIDTPKHRTPNVGKSRCEAIAEYQREYYNRDSELILSDTLQAHPCLSGAEDFCKADNTLAVGPGFILPKKRIGEGTGYVGWEWVSPPKDPAESLRKNKQDIERLKDKHACLAPPAGSPGAPATTVGQSGISKQLDAVTGHMLLADIGKSMARAERLLAEYAIVCLRNGPIDRDVRGQIGVVYPAQFQLSNLSDLTTAAAALQALIASAGQMPEVEIELLKRIVREALPGYSEEDYARLDAEIEAVIQAKATIKEQYREMAPGFTSHVEALEGDGSDEERGGEDPTGQSGGTMVSNMIPSVV